MNRSTDQVCNILLFIFTIINMIYINPPNILCSQVHGETPSNLGYTNNTIHASECDIQGQDHENKVTAFAQDENGDMRTQHNMHLFRILQIAEQFRDELNATNKQEGSVNDWKLVAMVLDRFFLIVFTLLGLVLTCTLLTQHLPYDEEDYLEKIV